MSKSKNHSSKAQRKEKSRKNKQSSKEPKAAPPCAAREAVLASPELLEAIFTFVSVRRLLISGQLVCTFWRDTISQSPQLQRRLFFRPEEEDEHNGSSTPAYPNPLMRRAFQPFFFPGHQRNSGPFQMAHLSGLPLADMKNGRKRHLAFTRTGASWRSMLVSQPPQPELFLIRYERPVEGGLKSAMTRLAGPVRMGQLYDLVCHGALQGRVSVAWGADPQQTLHRRISYNGYGRYFLPDIPTSDNHNIVVVQEVFPRERLKHPSKEEPWVRRELIKEIQSAAGNWRFLCEEYDAEAIERLIEEA